MISVLSVLQTLQKPPNKTEFTDPTSFFTPWLPERYMFQSGKPCLRCFNKSVDSFKVSRWILGGVFGRSPGGNESI